MCTEPSIWPSHSIGLTARPTSWAATTFSTVAGLGIEDDELGGVAEGGVDDGFSSRRPSELVQSTRYSPS
jgi:hypothetical protein